MTLVYPTTRTVNIMRRYPKGAVLNSDVSVIRRYADAYNDVHFVCRPEKQEEWRRLLPDTISVHTHKQFSGGGTVILESPLVIAGMQIPWLLKRYGTATRLWMMVPNPSAMRVRPSRLIAFFQGEYVWFSHNTLGAGVVCFDATEEEGLILRASENAPCALSHPHVTYAKACMKTVHVSRPLSDEEHGRIRHAFSDASYKSSQIKAIKQFIAENEYDWAIAVPAGPALYRKMFKEEFPSVTIITVKDIAKCTKPKILVQHVTQLGKLPVKQCDMPELFGRVFSLEPSDFTSVDVMIGKSTLAW
ncbi:hypothetical protein [Singapore grouper iridovirus]|nr:hypothetical protein [Singapore grouper iridovirus]